MGPVTTSAAELPRGLYCKHGHRLMKPPDDAGPDSFPGLKFIDPYPCDQPECSREQIEAEFQREEAEYQEGLWTEYRATW